MDLEKWLRGYTLPIQTDPSAYLSVVAGRARDMLTVCNFVDLEDKLTKFETEVFLGVNRRCQKDFTPGSICGGDFTCLSIFEQN